MSPSNKMSWAVHSIDRFSFTQVSSPPEFADSTWTIKRWVPVRTCSCDVQIRRLIGKWLACCSFLPSTSSSIDKRKWAYVYCFLLRSFFYNQPLRRCETLRSYFVMLLLLLIDSWNSEVRHHITRVNHSLEKPCILFRQYWRCSGTFETSASDLTTKASS